MIEKLRIETQNLEAHTHLNDEIYDDLVLEIKARLEQRINEVKDKVKVQPFADLQATNEATQQKMKALEEKIVLFEREKDAAKVANEQLSSKLEVLEAKNQ